MELNHLTIPQALRVDLDNGRKSKLQSALSVEITDQVRHLLSVVDRSSAQIALVLRVFRRSEEREGM